MYQSVQIVGRLGADPELRHTKSNTAVCNFSVATDESYTNRHNDERVDDTEWHRVVVWGKQGERCDQYLRKGSLVFVEGKYRSREWEDREGNKRKTWELVARLVKFLSDWGDDGQGSGRGDSGGRSGGGGEQRGGRRRSRNAPEFDDGFSDDDIPF